MDRYTAFYYPSMKGIGVYFLSNRSNFEKGVLILGVIVLLIYFVVYIPLSREKRQLVRTVESVVEELRENGYGTSEEEVTETLRRVEEDLRLLRNIDQTGHRPLDTDPLIKERIGSPFQYFEFDRERSAIISELRSSASAKGVTIDQEVIEALPDYVGQGRTYLLWAQLSLANQVLRGAVENGVERIETLQFPTVQRIAGQENEFMEEVSVRIRLAGTMQEIHPFLLYLLMDADQVERAGLPDAYSGKGGLFIDRFAIRKKSLEEPDHVVADLAIKSFIKLN